MILVDNSQVIMSSLFAQRDLDYTDESLIRHMVLNTYRMYRKRFGKEYGELVLCQEGQGVISLGTKTILNIGCVIVRRGGRPCFGQ